LAIHGCFKPRDRRISTKKKGVNRVSKRLTIKKNNETSKLKKGAEEQTCQEEQEKAWKN